MDEYNSNFNELINKKIYKILSYLSIHNDFYKKYIPLNFEKENSERIFESLPIMDKKTLNMCINENNINTDKIIINYTSGSTGIPLKCYKSQNECISLSSELWKQRKKRDINVNSNNLIDLFDHNRNNSIGNFSDLSMQSMLNCFANLINKNPRWICTSQSIIEKYAKKIESGELFYNNSIKYIELIGEKLVSERIEYIEKVFGAKTINHYGSRETWCIAYECICGKMHVLPNIYLQNTLNNEILVTSFVNKIMPVIKYNIADIGKVILSKCNCGTYGQVIDIFEGRKVEYIEGYEDIIGDLFFKRIIHDQYRKFPESIQQFRVIQTAMNRFDVNMICLKNKEEISNNISFEIKRQLGEGIEININFCEYILAEKEQTFIKRLSI